MSGPDIQINSVQIGDGEYRILYSISDPSGIETVEFGVNGDTQVTDELAGAETTTERLQ